MAFLLVAPVLAAVVLAFGTNAGPLDDPNQAFQRDGSLHHGATVGQEVGGVVFGRATTVVLFVRSPPAGPAYAAWRTQVLSPSIEVTVTVAVGQGSGPRALRAATGIRTPRDGGLPVGYAIVDARRQVRYATLDPAYLDHAAEVALLTAGLPGGPR